MSTTAHDIAVPVRQHHGRPARWGTRWSHDWRKGGPMTVAGDITGPPLPLHSGVPETHRVSPAIMAAPLRRPLELAHLPSTGGMFRE